MADVTITAASVTPGTGATQTSLTAGAAITAGQVVYKDTNGKAQLASAVSVALNATVYGIALNNAANGQPVVVQTAGLITIGGTVVLGAIYLVSGNNPGGVAPATDLTVNWRPVILGIATTTGAIQLQFNVSAVTIQHA